MAKGHRSQIKKRKKQIRETQDLQLRFLRKIYLCSEGVLRS